MQAFALILVYSLAAALGLGLASRFLRSIPLLWAVALALLPLVVTGRAVVTGGHFGPLNLAYASPPLAARGGAELHRDRGNGFLTDVAFQMVPWQAAVRRDLRGGRAPLWNPSIFCGDVLLGAAQPAPFHPSTLLGLLLPLSTARTLAAALGFFLGALCGFVFLREIGLSPASAFLGAAAWMLSLHFLFWTGWPQAQTFAVLPLAIAGLRRIARAEPGGFRATVAALVLALLGGHPESAFHVAFVAGLYFLGELFIGGFRGRAVAAALGAGILAFALAAPAILPVLEAIPQTVEGRGRIASVPASSHTVGEALRSAAGAISPDAYGGWLSTSSAFAPSFDSATAASVGGIALALAFVGAFSARREKWLLLVLAALTMAVAVGFPGIADAVNRLPVFRLALNNRLASATAFCLAALAAIGFEDLKNGEKRRAFLLPVIAAAAGAGVILRATALAARGISPAHLYRSGAFFAGGIVALFLAAVLFRRRPAPLGMAALAIFLVFRAAETPRLSPTFRSADFYPPIPEFTRLARGGEPYRVVGLGNVLVPNQSSLYGLEDARGYEAITNARLAETFPLWCVPQPIWFNRVDDPARPFLSLLNVRYAIAEPGAPAPDGWSEVTRGPAVSIFENPAALPRAFASPRVRFVPDSARVVKEMAASADFSRLAWIEAAEWPTGEIENGRATVQTREDGPDLVLDVNAEAPAWIVVSETNWKGWRAHEGNTRFPVVFADHAFIGFRIPAGRHRVRLEYRPFSFTAGLISSSAAIAFACLLAFAGDRRSRAFPDSPGRPDPASVERRISAFRAVHDRRPLGRRNLIPVRVRRSPEIRR